MVIERLQIDGFEKHGERFRIRFSPTVTTIVGESGTGKSTLIRALYWLAFNRPNDKSITSHDATKTTVQLWVDNRRIVRQRGSKGQLYRLDGKEFKAFGTEVPDAIASLLNVTPINFQSQSDLPYWMHESGGDVSKQLNSIVDLTVIDETLSSLAASTRKAQVVVELADDRQRSVNNSVQLLQYVPRLHKQLLEIERQDAALAATRKKSAFLESWIESVRMIESGLKRSSDAIQGGQAAVEAADKLRDIQSRHDDLGDTLSQIAMLTQTIDMAAKLDTGELDARVQAFDRIHQQRIGLEKVIDDIEHVDQYIVSTETCIVDAEIQLAKVKACPICNRPMK